MVAILNFCSLPSSTNVGQPHAVSLVLRRSRAWSKMCGGVAFEIASQSTVQKLFQFRFGGRHLESIFANVGWRRRLHTQVGHGRKCGFSRWNYVCMLLEIEITSTCRKSSIFPWRVPWFSTSLQVLGFDRILKFTRVAKIFGQKGGANVHHHPLFAG